MLEIDHGNAGNIVIYETSDRDWHYLDPVTKQESRRFSEFHHAYFELRRRYPHHSIWRQNFSRKDK